MKTSAITQVGASKPMTKADAIKWAGEIWGTQNAAWHVSVRGRAPAGTRYAVGRVLVGNYWSWWGYGPTWEAAFKHAGHSMNVNAQP